jgi:hypothetical protein
MNPEEMEAKKVDVAIRQAIVDRDASGNDHNSLIIKRDR